MRIDKLSSIVRIGALAAIGGTAAFATSSLTASASNFGSQCCVGTSGTTNGVFLTNNDFFNVIQRNLTATYAAGVDATIANSYNLPEGWSSATWADTSCDPAGHDTCVYDSAYGNNGFNGWNQCVSGQESGSHPDMVCDEAHVKINTSLSPPAERVACHEIAHSVALRHTMESTSCVKRTQDGGTSRFLSVHDCDHLEAEY